jgi:4-amino-4-deoxychorismate lyase
MILINGQYGNSLPVSDRGLQYGEGMWETIRIKNHVAILLQQHLARLQYGLKTLAIHSLDWDALHADIKTLQQQQKEAVLKIIISRGSGGRGYNPVGIHSSASRILSLHPVPTFPAHYSSTGIQLTLCQTRLAHNPVLAGFKHLNSLSYVMARGEFAEPYQEGLLRDYQDNIIEGTMSNVFIIKNNCVYTPELQACGIRGVMQNVLIQHLSALEIPLIWNDSLSVQAIQCADAVFMSNSIIGLWPVNTFSSTTPERDTTQEVIHYAPHPLIKQLQNTVKCYI